MVGGNWWGRQGEIGSWTSALLGGGDGGDYRVVCILGGFPAALLGS